MKFKLEFSMDNDAFLRDAFTESSRILTEVAYQVERVSEQEGVILDLNGNTIGKWGIIPD